MKKVLYITLLAIGIAGTAYAQEAWYEAAEASSVNYEINASKQVPQAKTAGSDKVVRADMARASETISRDAVLEEARVHKMDIADADLSLANTPQQTAEKPQRMVFMSVFRSFYLAPSAPAACHSAPAEEETEPEPLMENDIGMAQRDVEETQVCVPRGIGLPDGWIPSPETGYGDGG